MDLRRHIDKSRLAMTKAADGRVKIENREVPTDDFIWDFYLTPDEARKMAAELIRLADVPAPANSA